MVAFTSRAHMTTQTGVSCRAPFHGKPLPAVRPQLAARRGLHRVSLRGPVPCDATGLFFSTSTGHTEDVIGLIKEEFGDDASAPEDIGDADLTSLSSFDSLIVGAPTWNTGADSERSGTAWDNLLSDIRGMDLSKQKVAVFGLGDSLSYGDYFCDAMEEIYECFKASGASMVGHWPSDGYQHEDSKALIDGGAKFCGLALDEDNEDDQTLPRIKKWTAQLKSEFA